MPEKESFADHLNLIFFATDMPWKQFLSVNLSEVHRLRHSLNMLYPLLLRDSFPKAATKTIIANISLLIELMTGTDESGVELDDENLFELLEIGLYVIYLLTKKEKDIVLSSVAGSLMPLRHIQYKGTVSLAVTV